jgi:hypothetical protein
VTNSLVGTEEVLGSLPVLSTHHIGLLHCNAPTSAMAVKDLGRVKTLGRQEHVERPSFPAPNVLASNGKTTRKPRRW